MRARITKYSKRLTAYLSVALSLAKFFYFTGGEINTASLSQRCDLSRMQKPLLNTGKRTASVFSDVTPRVINQQLEEFVFHGIIRKKNFTELPPYSEYPLTETGKSLFPLIAELEKWGARSRPVLKEILGMSNRGVTICRTNRRPNLFFKRHFMYRQIACCPQLPYRAFIRRPNPNGAYAMIILSGAR